MRPALTVLFALLAPLPVLVQSGLVQPAFAQPALAQNANPSFTLANRGPLPIIELYATTSDITDWGSDRMARFSLSPGMTMPIRLPTAGGCVYDLRVVYADGRTEERKRLNTCQLDSVAFSGGRAAGPGDRSSSPPGRQAASDDPSFRLVNRGRSDVQSVYASPAGDDDWGQDRLGDATVAPGQTYVVRLPPGQCAYDVLVVFADRRKVERRRVDLCGITDFRVP